MWPSVFILFDGKRSHVSRTTRLWLGTLGISYPSKAGRVEVSGRRNWHKPNACYWTGIRNNNRTQYLQTASVQKGKYFGITIGVGRDRGVPSQYMMCHSTHCEQESGLSGLSGRSWHWCPSASRSGRSLGRQKSQCHSWGPYRDIVSHQRTQHIAIYCVKKRHWFTV